MAFDLRETEWAYLAGIIDGEGCIAVQEQKKGRFEYYTLFIAVQNTDESLIMWLRNKFGGGLTKAKKREGRKSAWTWTVAALAAEEILKNAMPYLIAKRDQAELAIEFRKSYQGPKPCSGRPLSPQVAEFRKHCFHKMRELKRPLQEVAS